MPIIRARLLKNHAITYLIRSELPSLTSLGLKLVTASQGPTIFLYATLILVSFFPTGGQDGLHTV